MYTHKTISTRLEEKDKHDFSLYGNKHHVDINQNQATSKFVMIPRSS